MEEWVLSKDYIPTSGAPRLTRSQTWDIVSLPNFWSQGFHRSSRQWHPCAWYRLLWLRWCFNGSWTAFRGWLVAINASGTPVGCIYGRSLAVSHLKPPRPDCPNRFLSRPGTNDLRRQIIIFTGKPGHLINTFVSLICWCLPRIASHNGCLWFVSGAILKWQNVPAAVMIQMG